MKKTVTYSVVGRVNPADRESGEVLCTVAGSRRDGYP